QRAEDNSNGVARGVQPWCQCATAENSRRAACRPAGSSRKAHIAKARRSSARLDSPSLLGLSRHTQLVYAWPVFFSVINGKGGCFIPTPPNMTPCIRVFRRRRGDPNLA